MKRLIIVLGLMVWCFNLVAQESDRLKQSKSLGLIAYLTYVKGIGEFKMTYLGSDERYKDPKFSEAATKFNAAYNLLKLSVDMFINQLSGDLYLRNRVGLFKKINRYIKSGVELPSKYAAYGILLKQIEDDLLVLEVKTYGGKLGGVGLDQIMGVAELGRGIITDARDGRQKKIELLTGLLKESKLEKLADLLEGGEDKPGDNDK